MGVKSRTSKRRRIVRRGENALGPGLHTAHVVMKLQKPGEGDYVVRLASGERVPARLHDDMQPSFADDCLRDGRLVLVIDTARGVEIAGALQTARVPVADARGALTIEAKDLRLRAIENLSVDVGLVSLRAQPNGALRMEGDRLVIDMAAMVRILSGRVDLP